MSDVRIVLFTRFPRPGTTKTRLIPTLGAEGAARLQREMAEHVLRTIRTAATRKGWTLEVAVAGDVPEAQAWLGPMVRCIPQALGDLGARMAAAFHEGLVKQGSRRMVILGGDCPAICPDHLRQAVDALKASDCVLGPAHDGGYYLIGLRAQAMPRAEVLFRGMPWGTDQLFSETHSRAQEAGLACATLETLTDIDRPEDLPEWQRVKAATATGRLSVIIPTLNEAARLPATLHCVCDADEVIVADGGSRDGTLEIARAHGARVVSTVAGRARQLNAGAQAATGDTYLFLHADTLVPRDYRRHIAQVLAQPKTAAGAFRFATEDKSWSMRIIAWSVNQRSRWMQLPYGDQGLFMHAEVFARVGGFPDMPIMDDYVFVRRLRREGRIGLAPVAAQTCSGRWRRLGPWRTFAINQAIVVGYYLGVPPDALVRLYRRNAKLQGANTPSPSREQK